MLKNLTIRHKQAEPKSVETVSYKKEVKEENAELQKFCHRLGTLMQNNANKPASEILLMFIKEETGVDYSPQSKPVNKTITKENRTDFSSLLVTKTSVVNTNNESKHNEKLDSLNPTYVSAKQ